MILCVRSQISTVRSYVCSKSQAKFLLISELEDIIEEKTSLNAGETEEEEALSI